MNTQNLYNNLMALCQNRDDGFLFKDYQQEGRTVRIFDYRLVSSSKFLLPDALNCRGTMFEIAPDGTMIQLLALPMAKFFGLGDNPSTLKLPLNTDTVQYIMDKPDGSLMSTYLWNNVLRLKSKGSIHSKEVRDAEAFLSLDSTLQTLLQNLTSQYTVDIEYTGPKNHICLFYDEPKLTILALRDRVTGLEYRLQDVLDAKTYSQYEHYNVQQYPLPNDMDAFLKEMRANKKLEGLIFDMKPGQKCARFKFKTDSYLALHHAKSAITRDSRDIVHCWAIKEPIHILAAIIHKKSDDLRHLMRETPGIVDVINEMEEEVIPKINHLENTLHTFYNENKHLDKANFARLASTTLGKTANIAIQGYIHNHINVLSYVEKNPSQFIDFAKYTINGPHYGNELHPNFTPHL